MVVLVVDFSLVLRSYFIFQALHLSFINRQIDTNCIDTNIFQICNDAGSNEELRVAIKTPFKLSLCVVIFNDSRLGYIFHDGD